MKPTSSRKTKSQTSNGDQRLLRGFYEQPTEEVARQLLGKRLVRHRNGVRISGIVVETEAYLSAEDPASHSHRGMTPRNRAMFEQAGTLYVYTIHAKYCLNVVTEPKGTGAAVLIRALEPWEGIDEMASLRGKLAPRELSTGPARLCQALGVDLALNGIDLCQSDALWLEETPIELVGQTWSVSVSPRIGISSAVEHPLRFFIDGHRDVSGLARHHQMPRGWSFQKRLEQIEPK